MSKLNNLKTRMFVISYKNIDKKTWPFKYYDSDVSEDFIEAVETFFEKSSIEVHYTEVEHIAEELAQCGFSYWKNKFIFCIF